MAQKYDLSYALAMDEERTMVQAEFGDWVKASDYTALAEAATWLAEVGEVMNYAVTRWGRSEPGNVPFTNSANEYTMMHFSALSALRALLQKEKENG